MPLELKLLSRVEKEVKIKELEKNLEYLQMALEEHIKMMKPSTIINSIEEVFRGKGETDVKMRALFNEQISRTEKILNNLQTSTDDITVLFLPESMKKKEVKAMLMALDAIQIKTKLQDQPLIQELAANLHNWLDQLNNGAPGAQTINYLPSESNFIKEMLSELRSLSTTYLSLENKENEIIQEVRSAFILNPAELLQFPKHELHWINKLQNTIISEITNYALDTKPRDLENFKKNLANKVNNIVKLIDKSSTMTQKFKLFINSCCVACKLETPFKSTEEIAQVRNQMKEKILAQREILEGNAEEIKSPIIPK